MSALIQSVERAIALLEAVGDSSGDGETVAELAARCGLNRATSWRLLATLEAYGFVHLDPATHLYSLGLAVPKLAAASSVVGLTWQAEAVLQRLSSSTGETAVLAVVQHLSLAYVAEVAPATVLQANWLGKTVPLHATSTGKALLAWLSEAELQALLSQPLPGYTSTTITTENALRAELAETRQLGYSVCAGELEETLYGVSAPVLDRRQRPFAVVSIWGPRDRVPASRFAELGVLACTAADDLAGSLRQPGAVA